MSSVGKGVATASLAKLLQSRGYTVTACKIDPYVNVDAGTMNPTEHGEVFVLDDGTECDQDMGSYERYLETNLSKRNYMTTGSVYLSLIQKERNLDFEGRCVHVVPDVPLEVLGKIKDAAQSAKADIVLIEIGGTIGDYQNVLYLEAARILKFQFPQDVMLTLVSYIPSIGGGGTELKTKPTQHAIQNLNAVGLRPDIVLARAKVPLDAKRKEKLEFMCSLEKGSIFSAPDVNNVYDIPLNFSAEGLDSYILKKLDLPIRSSNLADWKSFLYKSTHTKKQVKIAVAGKYFGTGDFLLHDVYISVIESIKHAAFSQKVQPVISWIDTAQFESDPKSIKNLSKYDGIIVPGGFGSRGTEGMIETVKYARTHNIPFLGLCYGLQMAVIEYARNVLKLDAHTTEVDPSTKHPVIHIMPDQEKLLLQKQYGGTMRLGAWPCELDVKSKAYKAYQKAGWVKKSKKALISERHRHRYEVNNDYREQLEKAGLKFSGYSPDKLLVEILELPKHKFFMATQFHPEFLSRPLTPHPLFLEFIRSLK
jgi:CTP synthase